MTATVSTAPQPDTDRVSRFTRSMLRLGLLALVAFAVCQAVSSYYDDKKSIRDAWLTDTIFVVVFSLVGLGIALFVGRRALNDDRRANRTVIGLVIATAIIGIGSWWNAVPVILCTAALLVGSVTGVTRRDGQHSGARAAAVVAGLLIVANLTLVFVGTLVENL